MKIVRAERFTGSKPWPHFVHPLPPEFAHQRDGSYCYIYVSDTVGIKHIKKGDWILTYENGHHDIAEPGTVFIPLEAIVDSYFQKECKTISILDKIEKLKYNYRKQNIYIGEIYLDRKEYEDLVNDPIVAQTIEASELNESKKHILWDGIHIVNNSLTLDEKAHITNPANEKLKDNSSHIT